MPGTETEIIVEINIISILSDLYSTTKMYVYNLWMLRLLQGKTITLKANIH